MTLGERAGGVLSAAVAPSLLREMNQRLLLDHLFNRGPAIRPQLARDTGLSLPTVIAALNGLEQVGLVRTAGRLETAHGRPAATYEADPTSGAVVGVDIGHDWIRLMVTDLAGTQLGRLEVRNNARGAKALVEKVRDAVAVTVAEARLTPRSITHTVIGSPGVYDRRRGRIQYAANLPGWQRAGLADALTERLGTEVTLDNDANLAALGEHTYGAARAAQDFVYLTIGTGVGLGLVLDGHLYRGATGLAGEAGYLPMGEELSAARPGRALRGTLEESLAATAVVRYAREAGLPEPLTAEAVFTAAREGDPAALVAVAREAQQLALLIATIQVLFDPELIVLGGGVGQNLDVLEPAMRDDMGALSPMTPTLAVGDLGRDAVVMGAVARGITIARDSVFRDRIERAG